MVTRGDKFGLAVGISDMSFFRGVETQVVETQVMNESVTAYKNPVPVSEPRSAEVTVKDATLLLTFVGSEVHCLWSQKLDTPWRIQLPRERDAAAIGNLVSAINELTPSTPQVSGAHIFVAPGLSPKQIVLAQQIAAEWIKRGWDAHLLNPYHTCGSSLFGIKDSRCTIAMITGTEPIVFCTVDNNIVPESIQHVASLHDAYEFTSEYYKRSVKFGGMSTEPSQSNLLTATPGCFCEGSLHTTDAV